MARELHDTIPPMTRVPKLLGSLLITGLSCAGAGCYASFARTGDAGADPPADTRPDEVDSRECNAGELPPDCAPTEGGECNIVDQCGCCGGDCRFLFDWDACTFRETCHGGLPGSCPAGWVYMIYPPDTTVGRCFEWCYDDSDCSLDGEWCNLPAKFDEAHPPCGHVDEYPIHICSDGTYG